MMLRGVIAALALMAMALPAAAAGIALIVANEEHAQLRDARGAAQVLDTESRLRAAGFAVETAQDLDAPALRAALSQLSRAIDDQGHERVVIVLSGYFLHTPQGVWLLGTEADEADLATIDTVGVRLETVLTVASKLQGGALVALADAGFPGTPGRGLSAGVPRALDVPQGVSLVQGPARPLTAFLRDAMVPGTVLAQRADGVRGVEMSGFTPPYLPLLPEGFEPARAADRAAFAAAQDTGTLEAYQDYLDSFPEGVFVDDARAAIEALETTPETIEDALALTRDERRAIQRDLTLLGHNTRGIDGIFGPGTRGSIRLWQERNDHAVTGFLTRDQIFQLAAQAARRAAEIEAEERERRAEAERRDRAFWAETGAAGDEPGLRAYLERYPQGIFASLARERLDAIAAERARARTEAERRAWDAARATDTVRAYEEFLADWPDGANAANARARIDQLRPPPEPEPEPGPGPEPEPEPWPTGPSDEQIARDRAAEQGLGLAQVSRVMIERQLRNEGYDPGRMDGSFDADTRAALADWQADNGQPPTGFVTPAVLQGLMRGAILGLFD